MEGDEGVGGARADQKFYQKDNKNSLLWLAPTSHVMIEENCSLIQTMYMYAHMHLTLCLRQRRTTELRPHTAIRKGALCYLWRVALLHPLERGAPGQQGFAGGRLRS